MGGIARSLIGLEHVIGKPVLLGELKVWIQDAMNPIKRCIRNIGVLRAILIVGIRAPGKNATWHETGQYIRPRPFCPRRHGDPCRVFVGRIGTDIQW